MPGTARTEPAVRALALHETWGFRPGDEARIDARGYVHIVGRATDLIISGGFNVYPEEVELAKFKVPKQVHFVDELPRNTMGKVRKNELRERLKGT